MFSFQIYYIIFKHVCYSLFWICSFGCRRFFRVKNKFNWICNNALISQAQYEKLVNLLQKTNLANSVQASITNQTSIIHSLVESTSCVICNSTTKPVIQILSWILDSGTNYNVIHVCFWRTITSLINL